MRRFPVNVKGFGAVQGMRGAIASLGLANARAELDRLLRTDGNTVAQYRADVGVTGSLAVSSWANQLGSAPALAQASGSNQPLYLPFSGEKYGYMPGVNGNFFSTPSAVANQVTGDIAIVIRLMMVDYTPAATTVLMDKFTAAGQYAYELYVNTSGTLTFQTSVDGTATRTANSSASNGVTDGDTTYFAVTRSASTGDTKFWKAPDGSNPATATWAQLGNTISGTTGAIFASTSQLNVGALIGGTLTVNGRIYRAQVYNGIPAFLGGSASNTPVVDFNPESATETTTNGATWPSTTGETWTLNATGSKPAQIVGSSQFLFDGTNSYMGPISFTLSQPVSVYGVIKPITWTNLDQFWDGATADTLVCLQQTSSPNVDLYAGNLLAAQLAFPLNATSIIRAVYNTTSSGLARNAGAAVTGNVGTANPAGFTLGRYGNASSRYGNFQCKEIIIRNTADSAATQALIAQYLNAIHGVF